MRLHQAILPRKHHCYFGCSMSCAPTTLMCYGSRDRYLHMNNISLCKRSRMNNNSLFVHNTQIAVLTARDKNFVPCRLSLIFCHKINSNQIFIHHKFLLKDDPASAKQEILSIFNHFVPSLNNDIQIYDCYCNISLKLSLNI